MKVNMSRGRTRLAVRVAVSLVVLGALAAGGCSKPKVTRGEPFTAFEKAGPWRPTVDMERLASAQVKQGEYTVGQGDVLQFNMPMELWSVEAASAEARATYKPYLVRVNPSGQVNLPIVGAIEAAGKTVPAIEQAIEQAYYPKYISYMPSVVGEVVRYRTESVTVVGAVRAPGVYALRGDELTLVSALMKAGSIVPQGAGLIRIKDAVTGASGAAGGDEAASEPLLLPVQGLSIPFRDVALRGGEVIEVDPLNAQVFTVIGLVGRPGAYPYPDGAGYNVLQALAMAGGLNGVADPQYVRVYRQTADGDIVDATLKIAGTDVENGAAVRIKPGDVVSVEQTGRTRTRLLMAEIFRVYVGVNASAWYRVLEGRDVTTRD